MVGWLVGWLVGCLNFFIAEFVSEEVLAETEIPGDRGRWKGWEGWARVGGGGGDRKTIPNNTLSPPERLPH